MNQYSEFKDDMEALNKTLPPEEKIPKDLIYSQAVKAAFKGIRQLGIV